jgi:hypothetical protein
VSLEEVGINLVRVSGAKGWAPPTTLKACAQIPDGWRAQFLLFIAGRDAAAKARRVGADMLERSRAMLQRAGLGDFAATHVEVLGAEDSYGPHARSLPTREVVLRIAVHHESRDAVVAFIREIPSIALAGPPGISGGGTGLPTPTPLIRLECFPVDREDITPVVEIDGSVVQFADTPVPSDQPDRFRASNGAFSAPLMPENGGGTLPLVAIAHGRSGDKGADVNVGIRARHPDFFPVLLRELTAERVAAHLSHLGADSVDRFELPGIDAVNFLLHGGLGAGGTASLRFDPQGKAVAQQLLDLEVEIPAGLAGHPALRPV